jgi:hypothetical protein
MGVTFPFCVFLRFPARYFLRLLHTCKEKYLHYLKAIRPRSSSHAASRAALPANAVQRAAGIGSNRQGSSGAPEAICATNRLTAHLSSSITGRLVISRRRTARVDLPAVPGLIIITLFIFAYGANPGDRFDQPGPAKAYGRAHRILTGCAHLPRFGEVRPTEASAWLAHEPGDEVKLAK